MVAKPKERVLVTVVKLPENFSVELWRKRLLERMGIKFANNGEPILDVFELRERYKGRKRLERLFQDKYLAWLFFSLFWGPYFSGSISLILFNLPIIIYVFGFLPFFLISIVLMVKTYA